MTSLLVALALLALPFVPRADEAPPIPKGYSSELEIKAAILLKQLPIISVPKDPPAGVRRQPATPSVRNSAIDLPLRMRRKTVP